MRVLVLSSVFPNPAQPALGVFVRERMLRVARRCDLEVVAPVPWFPLVNGVARPHVRAIPAVERQGPLTVWHPRFLSVPRYLKALDGAGYAASLLPFLARLRRRFAFDLIDAHFAYPDGVAAALPPTRRASPAKDVRTPIQASRRNLSSPVAAPSNATNTGTKARIRAEWVLSVRRRPNMKRS